MEKRTTDYPTDEVLAKFDDYLEVNDIYSHEKGHFIFRSDKR